MARKPAIPDSSPWLFGPTVDLLLGCGVGYAILAVAMGALPVERATLLQWGVLSTFVTGMPHYGATLVRVYENPADRSKYVLFTLWASLLIWSWFALSVYVPLAGSLLLTAYLNWSPWHYAGQNYGIACLFVRRRGIALDRALKRPLYGSFITSTALVLLTLNGAFESGSYAPNSVPDGPYRMLKLGIPQDVFGPLFGLLLLAHLGSLIAFAWRVARRATRASDVLPAVLLLATQAMWFTIPSAVIWAMGVRLEDESVVFFFLWAGIGHAIQYLWVTTYYAAGAEKLRPRLAYLGKTLAAGAIAFTVPALLFAPGLLGGVAYDYGLALIVASAVNVQHFVLDGAIWKLRDGPVARVLLGQPDRGRGDGKRKGEPHAEQPSAVAPGAGWARRGFWAMASLFAVLAIAAPVEYERGWISATAREDHARAARAERRLAWVGRDSPVFHERRARLAADRGQLDTAAAEYESALALFPKADTWKELGLVRAMGGDVESALAAFDEGFELAHESWVVSSEADADAAIANRRRELEQAASEIAANYWLARGDSQRADALLRRASELSER